MVTQVFISHAEEDADFAHRLADDLKRLGAPVWIAPGSILPGESWLDAIERGLSESSHAVMVLTPAALEASGVKMERDMAITLALDDQIRVISLRVKPCEVPLVLSRYQMILAFEKDYEAGLNELAGHLGLRAAPPETVGIETPQATERRLLGMPLLALAALSVLVIGVVVIALVVSGLIGGTEEPSPVPTTSVPLVAEGPTHTPRPSAATSTSAPVVTDTPVLPTDTLVPASWIPPSSGSLYDTWTRPADGMEMVYVPGGTFEMGSTDGESDERPVHAVTLDSFWIDKTEVTNDQFARFVQATNYRTDAEKAGKGWVYTDGGWSEVDGADWQHPNGPETSISDRMDHPVVQVSWNDAKTYCQRAGGRLPTEAEWEYAVRGPDGHIYPWGKAPPNDNLLNYAMYVGDTTEVGSYPDGASWVGAMDMAGNVWEWVNDWYNPDYYASSPPQDPTGPETDEQKVLRGGGWDRNEEHVRAASRYKLPPVARSAGNGFRCVVEPGN